MGPREQLTRAIELRASTFEKMKAINDKQANEARALTAEESQEYTNLTTELRSATDEVKRLEDYLDIEGGISGRGTRGMVPDAEQRNADEPREERSWTEFMVEKRGGLKNAGFEYRDAFHQFLAAGGNIHQLGNDEQRALNTSPGPDGGYLVPATTERQLHEKLVEYSPLRALATVLTTATGEDLIKLREVDFGEARWTANNTALFESDVVLGQSVLKAYLLTRIIRVPWALMNDSVIDLEDYLAGAFARSMGVAESAGYLRGDGVNKPTGVLKNIRTAGAKVAATTGAQGSILGSLDGFIDMQHSVKAAYRNNGKWLAHDLAVAAMRKYKDGNGQYQWSYGTTAGAPDTFLGKPVYTDNYLDEPVAGADARSVIFGDFKQGVVIRDVAGVGFKRLDELFAGQGQVGFLAAKRSDAAIDDPDALVAQVLA